MVIIDSSDDEDFNPDDPAASTVVAEPSLEDLRNMGLVQDPDSPSSQASSMNRQPGRAFPSHTQIVRSPHVLTKKSVKLTGGQKQPISSQRSVSNVEPPSSRWPAGGSSSQRCTKTLASSQPSQKSDLSQSSVASNDLDMYTESLGQVRWGIIT